MPDSPQKREGKNKGRRQKKEVKEGVWEEKGRKCKWNEKKRNKTAEHGTE